MGDPNLETQNPQGGTPPPTPEPSPQPSGATPAPQPPPTPAATPSPEPPRVEVPPEIQKRFPDIKTREDYEAFLEHGPVLFSGAIKAQLEKQEAEETRRRQSDTYRARKAFKNEILEFAKDHKTATGEELDFVDLMYLMLQEQGKRVQTALDPREVDTKINQRIAYHTFWNKPEHADIASDAETREMVEYFVSQKQMKPTEAVNHVRKLTGKQPPAPRGQGADRKELPQWMHIEGTPASPEPRGETRLSRAMKHLEEVKSKPPGERGSEAMFNLWKE